ncbi:hypothetical protein CUJ89_04190 [Burkholderia pyrrocinia]|uniref:Uncharacterized protein n=1 Tax=Burkholderia pyrrocinia TaxID=60550 RepID=A0A2Z5MRH4_BURPY|nr:hypothetical protein CUJ89_04190 [Burkholderia pyrrocinia]
MFQYRAGFSRQARAASPRLTGTRDFDFPQPAPFLRLTDIASVFNNRLRNRKPIFRYERELGAV